MGEAHYLREVVIVIGTAVAVAWLFRVVRIPSIIGFLLTGIAIGPSGFQLIPPEEVEQFAELGLILLLFIVGIELSPQPLIRAGTRLMVAAGVQIVATTVVTILILEFLSPLSFRADVVIGLGVALSSTAIALKQMSDKGETTSTTGLIATGILLLQDVVVIVVLLAASVAYASSGQGWAEAGIQGVLGLAGLAGVVVVARRLLPRILAAVIRQGGRELACLFAVLMACGGAWSASLAGWSPALGACIAGLLLAQADERHQLVAEITPFRDVFNAVFFISLGMSVQLETAFAHFLVVGAAVLATPLVKTALTAFAIRLAGWPTRVGIHVGLGMCTVSEFSYVLAHQAYRIHLLPEITLDLIVAYAVGTMMLGALFYPFAGRLSILMTDWLAGRTASLEGEPGDGTHKHFTNHVILVGYGTTGFNLARMLRETHLPHCLVEMNQTLVKQARDAGETVIVGDATRVSILEHGGIDSARVLVVAVNDRQATQRIVAQARARRPGLYILARAPFVSDIDLLLEKGATLVVPEDFETSLEVAAHVLRKFGVPDNVIEAQIAAARTGGYAMLRGKATGRAAHEELTKILERTTTQTFYLSENNSACGVTIGRLNIRALTGSTIIAVVRSGVPTTNPPPDFVLHANDTLVLVGAHPQIEAAKTLLQGKGVPQPRQ